MAESNATQVILTDDGIKIIKAQNTADNAASGITNLNDPNLMNVIEKQTQVAQYAGLTSQYKVVLARAKEANISTTALTTAYTNLNTFMAAILTDTTKASDVNRDSYKALTDAYNSALSSVQNALSNSFNTDIDNMQSSVSVASQAASSAVIVASQATVTGNSASQVASQAVVVASEAKSAGNNATRVANNASQVASGAVIAGSTASVNADKAVSVANQAKSAGDNATRVANNASQAASGAILAGSQATVIANKASTVANEAKSAGDNATSVANNATSVANSARSTADSTYAYANSEIAVQSTATAKAQSKADDAFDRAQAVGSQASAEISSNSTATAKAQSTADNAFSQATVAIDNNQVTSQAVTDLKDGSKLTIAELENGLATKVANSEYASYKIQTASQIASKVDNGDFSTYKTQTADLIAQKVANKDFTAYQDTTAKAISSKVESGDFNTYKTQTANLINDKVSSAKYTSDKTQTDKDIASKVSSKDFNTYKTQTDGLIAEKVATKDFSTYKTQTADLIASKVATKDFSAYQATTAKSIDSKVESKDFNTYKTQTADMISSKVESKDFQALQTQVDNSAVGTNLAIGTNQEYAMGYGIPTTSWTDGYAYLKLPITSAGEILPQASHTFYYTLIQGTTYTQTIWFETDATVKDLSSAQVTWFTYAHDYQPARVQKLGQNSYKVVSTYTWPGKSNNSVRLFDIGGLGNAFDVSTGTYLKFGKLKLEKGSLSTDWCLNPEDQATQSQITQLSGEIDLRVTKGDLVDQINVQAGKTLISSSGQLILSGNSVVLDSVDPVIMKSANIGNMAVGTAQIANGAITNAQIGSLAVDTANIKDAAISSAKIANLAVGTAQIGDGAITNAKIGKLAVGTAQIANGAITDAQIGSLAVGTAQIKDEAVNSAKIAKLAVGTAQIGDGAITNAKIGKLAVGTAQIANAAITDAQIGNVSANKLTAGTIDFNTITGKNINASNITTGTLNTDRLNVEKLSALSANLGDVTTGSLKGVDIVANTFSTPNGSFTTDANGNVVASNLTVRGVTNLAYNASLLGGVGGSNSSIPGWTMGTMGYFSNVTLHDGVPSIRFNGSTGASTWQLIARPKLYPLNGLTGQPYSASVWFIDIGSEAAVNYQFSLAFFDANGNRLASGLAGNTWNGNPNSQDWTYKTINNAVSPSNAAYVAIQLYAYNGKGNVAFSSPMLTQTAQSTGYQPDTGNVVSAGEIDGSVINGSTINGTTFNAGTKLNQYGNTSYPLTISSDGSVDSTISQTNSGITDILRTRIKDGQLITNFRRMSPYETGKYLAGDTNLGIGQLSLYEGYSTSADANFSTNSLKATGYTILNAGTGLSLHGSTQGINFGGADLAQTTGITMNSYGNIIGNPNSTWWRIVSNSGSNIANFGIDKGGSNAIQFNRELDIGNFQINTGHTFTSADGGDIHFAKGGGGAANIYAGAVNYTSLVKSSLLSVKKDVQKADTAYWAQLVNSIDLATYQYKTDDNTSHLRLSSIVDDVNVTKQWQLPDVFISRDENGKLNGVDDSVLLNATLATVQEQQKQIDQLNGHLLELEAKLNG